MLAGMMKSTLLKITKNLFVLKILKIHKCQKYFGILKLYKKKENFQPISFDLLLLHVGWW